MASTYSRANSTQPVPYATTVSLCSQDGNGSHSWTMTGADDEGWADRWMAGRRWWWWWKCGGGQQMTMWGQWQMNTGTNTTNDNPGTVQTGDTINNEANNEYWGMNNVQCPTLATNMMLWGIPFFFFFFFFLLLFGPFFLLLFLLATSHHCMHLLAGCKCIDFI